MPLRRVSLCFVVFALALSFEFGATIPVFAQAHAQDPSTEHLYPTRSVRPTGDQTTFTVTLDTNWLDVSVDNPAGYEYTGTITNIDTKADSIKFLRTQYLPCGWTSSICFGTNCYSPLTDSATYYFPPNVPTSLIIHLFPSFSSVPLAPVMHFKFTSVNGPVADTMLVVLTSSYTPSDPHTYRWQNTVFDRTFTGPNKHSVQGGLVNLTCAADTLDIRAHAVLPTGWTGKFCVNGDVCAIDSTIRYAFAETGNDTAADYRSVSLSVTVPSPLVTTDSAIFYVSVHRESGTADDTGNYRFSIVVNPVQNSVASGESDARAGVMVINAWPNPLLARAKLNLDIMTDRDGPAQAHVYDMGGVEKATFDAGELTIGSNRIALSGLAIPSGEYIVRIQQDGASSGPVRINFLR